MAEFTLEERARLYGIPVYDCCIKITKKERERVFDKEYFCRWLNNFIDLCGDPAYWEINHLLDVSYLRVIIPDRVRGTIKHLEIFKGFLHNTFGLDVDIPELIMTSKGEDKMDTPIEEQLNRLKEQMGLYLPNYDTLNLYSTLVSLPNVNRSTDIVDVEPIEEPLALPEPTSKELTMDEFLLNH